MSTNLARALRPNERDRSSAPARDERHFEIVSPEARRRARPRIFYALTAIAGMAAIVVAQLLLSVGISQGAYEISTLQSNQVELGRTAESVSEDLVRVSSPQSLAANAEALGMVSNSNPVYLRLSDGAVLGAPSSATGSQAGAASLVPNALLSDAPLLAKEASGTGKGASLSGTADAAESLSVTSAPVVPKTAGLPSPTTR